MRRLVLLSILLTLIVAAFSVTAVNAQGPSRQYIVISRSQFGVSSSVLNQIRSAGGQVRNNLSRMGLMVVTSNNPNFARSIPAARAVALDLRMKTDKPNVYKGPTLATAPKIAGPPNAPDIDPLFNLEWNITAVDAQNAWLKGRLGQGALVAVLDEGVDATHPDLAGNVRTDLGTSFAQDCTGGIEPFQPPPPAPGDAYFNHGTHVAGIIAAQINGIGTIGVAPKAQIMPVDVLSRCLGYGQDDWALQGMQYAADHGADVINMSLGGLVDSRGGCDDAGNCYTHDDIVNSFLAYSYAALYANSKGTTVFASSGNDGVNYAENPYLLNLPSDALGIEAISATAPIGWAVNPHTNLDLPTYYSNFGPDRIDFAGPGGTDEYAATDPDSDCTVAGSTAPCYVFDFVISDSPGGWYWAAGTSMASPHAAGVAAQYIGASGGTLSPALVEYGLRLLADHPNGNPHRDPFYGYGRVDTTPPDPSP